MEEPNETTALLATNNPSILVECPTTNTPEIRNNNYTIFTKEEVLATVDDPFWKMTRFIIFISFWLLMSAMIISATIILINAPKCDNQLGTVSTRNNGSDPNHL